MVTTRRAPSQARRAPSRARRAPRHDPIGDDQGSAGYPAKFSDAIKEEKNRLIVVTLNQYRNRISDNIFNQQSTHILKHRCNQILNTKLNQTLKQKKHFSEQTNKIKFPTKTYSIPSFLVITIFNIIGCIFGDIL